MGDSLPMHMHAFPIVSNGAYQDKPQIKNVKFHLVGFCFDCKEVFIVLHGHLGSAGIGVNLKAICQEPGRCCTALL